jgi:hypothetical protein
MYNSDMPSRAELPTSGQLLRSTLIAAGVAAALLVTVVLPAEYGIDPTGAGRALGLTQMGEIKVQLHQEAEADRVRDQATGQPPAAPATQPPPEKRSSLIGGLFAQLVIGPAAAHEPTWDPGSSGASAAGASPHAAGAPHSDETTVTLKPGEGVEFKMDMKKGAKATYAWTVEGGTVNHDTHGEPFGKPDATHSYRKGRSVSGDKGVLTAAFDGNHGWYWRNRGSKAVTVRLTTSGEYGSLKRVQ